MEDPVKGYWESAVPGFPDNVPIVRLNKVSLQKLLTSDVEESARLFSSCCGSGFFLLDLEDCTQGQTLVQHVCKLYALEEQVFNLEYSVKQQYALRDGTFYGYKATGYSKVDNKGTPDRCEFWGISKDGIVGVGEPEPLPDNMDAERGLLQDFVKDAHAICILVLTHINQHLGLPIQTLEPLHALLKPSADQVRLLKMPPQPENDRRTSLLAHTDVGSITLVFNVLGGLQVQRNDVPYNSDQGWEFVRPEKNCAVVNIGDALRRLSGGVVRSSLHRVAYAPGKQGDHDRYSLAYFSRPLNDVSVVSIMPKEAQEAQETKGRAHENGVEWDNLTNVIGGAAEAHRQGAIPDPQYNK